MYRDTTSYIGQSVSSHFNWICQTFIAFLLCAKNCGCKNEWDVVCALKSSWFTKSRSPCPLPPPPPCLHCHSHSQFLTPYPRPLLGRGMHRSHFCCLHHVWVGFLPSPCEQTLLGLVCGVSVAFSGSLGDRSFGSRGLWFWIYYPSQLSLSDKQSQKLGVSWVCQGGKK